MNGHSVHPAENTELKRLSSSPLSDKKNADEICFPTSTTVDMPDTSPSTIAQPELFTNSDKNPAKEETFRSESSDEDASEEEMNFFMVFVSNTQEGMSDFYKNHRNWILGILILIVCSLYTTFLVYGCVSHWEKTLPLLVLTITAVLFLLYYLVLKPRFGHSFHKNCWTRFVKLVQKLSAVKPVKYVIYFVLLLSFTAFLAIDTYGNRWRLMSFGGLLFFILFCFIFSKNPAKVKWRPVFWGISLQFIFGLLILRWSVGTAIFNWLSDKVNGFIGYTFHGTSFVYGFLVDPPCGLTSVFAFAVLPMIIFFSSVVSILYYLGVMQYLIARIGAIMEITMGTTAAESLSAAGNIFIGQTESPLLIKPYLSKLTMSELAAVMTGGFATIAGSVFGVYVSFGACANHILSASVMSAPAALAISKLFYPETQKSSTKTSEDVKMAKGSEKNVIEAAANGASNGIFLVANIIANLIAFLAFLAFFNNVVQWLGAMIGFDDLSFEKLMSWLFYPVAFMMGASNDPKEILIVAELMGIKTFLNEFIAYKKMSDYLAQGLLSRRAQLVATYALCGFSNLASVGVQLGGLGAMCPERRSDLAKLALRTLIAGSIACFMTACVAGLLVNEVSECVGAVATNQTCKAI